MDVTFVCCVESGGLEAQCVRMIESLRRWGGVYSECPIFAVNPRFGAPLSKKTRSTFDKLEVKYISFNADNPYSWKGFLNKHYALAKVESIARSSSICWLDSDLLFLSEPTQLALEKGVDFKACTPDAKGASTGINDPMDLYWQGVCNSLGIDIDSLPYVTTCLEEKKVRFYFNSGVFIYKRSTNLSQLHLENTLKFFDTRLAPKHIGSFFFTQHTLGITIAKMGLTWSSLPWTYNYNAGSSTDTAYMMPERLKEVKILHYHDSLWPNNFSRLLNSLRLTHPEVASWLDSLGPLKDESSLEWKIFNLILNNVRKRKETRYVKTCSFV
jgi:hypothetical protein